MMRTSGRMAALAVATVLLGGAWAQAAIIGSATLVKDPSAALPFGPPDAALGAPWVSYKLSLSASDGDLIQAVVANISGQLHQRWSSSGFDGVYDTATGNSTNLANGDSHFLAITAGSAMLFANGPNEDNPASGSPLSPSNTESTGWGVGTSMSATFGPTGAGLAAMDVAYIVVPKGSEPSLDIRVDVLNPAGDTVGSLDVGDFFGVENLPPIVDDLGPLLGDQSANGPNVPTIVSGTLPASDDGGLANLSWAFDGASTGPAAPLNAPTLDPATGLFSWDVNGQKGGLYSFLIKATDAGGLSDNGTLTVNVIVPEPATVCLIGLALVGFAGFRRK